MDWVAGIIAVMGMTYLFIQVFETRALKLRFQILLINLLINKIIFFKTGRVSYMEIKLIRLVVINTVWPKKLTDRWHT